MHTHHENRFPYGIFCCFSSCVSLINTYNVVYYPHRTFHMYAIWLAWKRDEDNQMETITIEFTKFIYFGRSCTQLTPHIIIHSTHYARRQCLSFSKRTCASSLLFSPTSNFLYLSVRSHFCFWSSIRPININEQERFRFSLTRFFSFSFSSEGKLDTFWVFFLMSDNWVKTLI